jgi:hypothetical protein
MEKFDTSGAGTAYPSGAPEFTLGFFVGYNTPTTWSVESSTKLRK